MVVFIICLSLIMIILIISLAIKSTTKLKLADFVIDDYDDLKEIIKLIKNKEYIRIFECLDFLLTLELCIFKKLPIFKFRVSDDEIAKFLKKQIKKHKLKKEEKDIKLFAEEDKKQIDEDLPDIDLESFELLMNLGTENAGITAISSAIISILISVTLPILINKINLDKFNYKINPVYLDKPFFNINASAVLSISTVDLVKLIR